MWVLSTSLHPLPSQCMPAHVPQPPPLPESFLCPCVTGQLSPERSPGPTTNRNWYTCFTSSSLSVTIIGTHEGSSCSGMTHNSGWAMVEIRFLLPPSLSWNTFPVPTVCFLETPPNTVLNAGSGVGLPLLGTNQAKMLNHVPKVTKLDCTPGSLDLESVIFPTVSHASWLQTECAVCLI